MAFETEQSLKGIELFREQYLYRHPPVSEIGYTLDFTDEEISLLRSLAEQVAHIAETGSMREKSKRWTALHDLKDNIPVIFVDPENGWNEVMTDDVIRCRNQLARTWENMLRKDIFSAEMIQDDRVITRNFNVPYYWTGNDFGIRPKIERTTAKGGAYHISAAIEDYERDFGKLSFPQLVVDWDRSRELLDYASKVFDGILDCRLNMKWQWDDSFLDRYVELRGMEDFMCDFVAEPEWISTMMEFITDGVMQRFDWLEEQGLLSLNNDETYLGTGGQGYTTCLPGADFKGKVRTCDMWGTMQAQETVSINPDQFGELILPHFKRLASRFGLVHYGCCEPYNPRWKYVKEIPNLRHVSVSPWAKLDTVPELLGTDYVASVKLKPTPLAMPVMNEDVVRRDCRKAVEETYGGICEFIMKDNHTIGGDPGHLIRWTQIMREEIERKYG